MKILFVSEFYPPHIQGGAEVSTSLVAEWLAAHGHEVAVACTEVQAEPWTRNGVTAYPIVRRAFVGSKSAWASIKYAIDVLVAPVISASRIMKLVRTFQPDAINVVVTQYGFMPMILLLRIFSGKPVFIDCREYSLICPVHFKNDEIEDPKRAHHGYRCLARGYHVTNGFLQLFIVPFAAYEALLFNIYKATLRFAINHGRGITLVPLSDYVRRELVLNGFRDDRCVMIRNISPAPTMTNSAAGKTVPPTFAYGGRIETEKGVWDLVSAVEILRKETNKPFRVEIAGTGMDLEKLKAYLAEHKDLPITLLGKVTPEEVVALYRRAVAILAPSRWPEPFGRFIQEGMSAGVPVIGTNAGGIPEGVKDGVSGRLFEVGDVRAFADAMKMFIDNPEASKTMGDAMAAQRPLYAADLIGSQRLALYKGDKSA